MATTIPNTERPFLIYSVNKDVTCEKFFRRLSRRGYDRPMPWVPRRVIESQLVKGASSVAFVQRMRDNDPVMQIASYEGGRIVHRFLEASQIIPRGAIVIGQKN